MIEEASTARVRLWFVWEFSSMFGSILVDNIVLLLPSRTDWIPCRGPLHNYLQVDLCINWHKGSQGGRIHL